MQITLASALLAIVVFQLFFIAAFLFINQKGKVLSNRILGVFFLMLGVSMLDMWLSIHELYEYYARVAFLNDGFVLALGPIILLYARTIMYDDYAVTGRSILHFIPFLLITIYLLLISILPASEVQRQMVRDVQDFNLPLIVHIIGTLFYAHPLIYLVLSFKEVQEYRRLVQEEYSSDNKMNVEWLVFTIKSLGILIVLAIAYAIIPYSSSRSITTIATLIFIGFIFHFANQVIMKGLMRPYLFHGISGSNETKYKDSNLTDEERIRLTTLLSDKMKADKPYLDADLTIKELANTMGIPAKTLSQVINQSHNKSFFDFINHHRVGEAMMIIGTSNDDKMTIQEVMYRSGFNSKSSFNTFFKKITGLTPSEYKIQHK